MNAFDDIPLVKLYTANLKQENSQNNNIQPEKTANTSKKFDLYFIIGKFMLFYSIYFRYFEDILLDNY